MGASLQARLFLFAKPCISRPRIAFFKCRFSLNDVRRSLGKDGKYRAPPTIWNGLGEGEVRCA